MPHSYRPEGQREIAVTRTQNDMDRHLRTCGLRDRNTVTASLRPGREGARGISAPTSSSPCHHFPSTKQTEPPLEEGRGQRSTGMESIHVQFLECRTRREEWMLRPQERTSSIRKPLDVGR